MAFFFEDAAERNALYQRNLVVLVRRSFSLLQVDMTPAAFWITHPTNRFIGNHAVGAHNFGFWFDVKPAPRRRWGSSRTTPRTATACAGSGSRTTTRWTRRR